MGLVEIIGTVICLFMLGAGVLVMALILICGIVLSVTKEYHDDPKGTMWSCGLTTLFILGLSAIALGRCYGI